MSPRGGTDHYGPIHHSAQEETYQWLEMDIDKQAVVNDGVVNNGGATGVNTWLAPFIYQQCHNIGFPSLVDSCMSSR